jgi:hypothetical protein
VWGGGERERWWPWQLAAAVRVVSETAARRGQGGGGGGALGSGFGNVARGCASSGGHGSAMAAPWTVALRAAADGDAELGGWMQCQMPTAPRRIRIWGYLL